MFQLFYKSVVVFYSIRTGASILCDPSNLMILHHHNIKTEGERLEGVIYNRCTFDSLNFYTTQAKI